MATIMSIARGDHQLSLPRLLLHMEGFAVLSGAVALYAYHGYSWLAFGVLLLAPDVALAVYALNASAGTVLYNLLHSYTLPLLLAVLSVVLGAEGGLQVALIWSAHIGMDRMLGYGLKYPTGFNDTHLSRV